MSGAGTDDPKVIKMKPKKPAPKKSWQERLILTEKDTPKACLANAITALRYAPEWDGVLWYDEFAVRTVARRPPPWRSLSMGFQDADWEDRDDIRLAEWLQHQGISVNPMVAAQAVEVVASNCRYHPVREYLDDLEWDGVHRNWLHDYLGTADNDYTQAVGIRWMISAVARIYEPGCKADCALILEGPQSLKKSTALRVLGGPWFTDQMSDLGSKDSCVDVQGAWIIELSELDSMARGEVGTIKAFMSRQIDRYRPPYGRRTVKQPRQCVFAGTVNPEGAGYLKDPTGGRRFWPVECTKIDTAGLERDVHQLWAEAVAMYNEGFSWWLDTTELEEEAKRQQAERYQDDPWDHLISRHLTSYKVLLRNDFSDVIGEQWIDRAQPIGDISIAEILTDVLKIDEGRWTKADQMRIGGILTAMGFQRYRRRINGRPEWRYLRSVPTSQGGNTGGNTKKPTEINDVPTVPTVPTFSKMRKTLEQEDHVPEVEEDRFSGGGRSEEGIAKYVGKGVNGGNGGNSIEK